MPFFFINCFFVSLNSCLIYKNMDVMCLSLRNLLFFYMGAQLSDQFDKTQANTYQFYNNQTLSTIRNYVMLF